MRQFDAWKDHFKTEDFVVNSDASISKLNDDLFQKQKLEHLSFEGEIPEELTGEKYLQMYKVIWAVIRHDLYKAIVARKKELGVSSLPADEFGKLYDASH